MNPDQKKQLQQEQLKLICAACQKPVQKSSITGWLFQTGCQCARDSSVSKSKTSPKMRLVVANTDGGRITKRNPNSNADPEVTMADTSPAVLNEDVAALEEKFPLATKYKLQALLGQGGMGAVYKVKNRVLGKTFAVKLLRPELVKDEPAIKRFEQEAKAASSLTHPNLVAVYDYGMAEDGAPYLVMDYLDGVSLEAIIKSEGSLATERAMHIFVQVCDALAHAHGKRIIHRDLKPSNILLIDNEESLDFVKIVDFGIAKILAEPGAEQERLTQTGDILGSPLYMSPEQCMGYPLDTRSDIYSVGCLMYEALAGVPPFGGVNPVQVIFEHINSEPKPFSEQGLKVPKDLESIVRRCLEKEAEHRYQTVEDLKDDLLRFQQGLGISRAGEWSRWKRLFLKRSRVMLVAAGMAASIGLTAWYFSAHQQHVGGDLAWHNLDIEGQQSFDRMDYPAAEKKFNESLQSAQSMQNNKPFVKASLTELLDLYHATSDNAKAAAIQQQLDALQPADEGIADMENQLQKLASGTAYDVDKAKIAQLGENANDMAVSLIEEGGAASYDRAESLLTLTKKMTEKYLSDDDRVMTRCLHNLAYLAHSRGQYASAVTQYENALAKKEKILARDDVATAATAFGLGRAYLQTNAPAKSAEEALNKALSIYRHALGPQSDQVAWTRFHLAGLYDSVGRKADALTEIKTAIAIYEHASNPNLNRKARCYMLQGKMTGNLSDYKTALALFESQTEKDGIFLAETLLNIGSLTPKGFDSAKAEPYLKRALAIAQRFPPAEKTRMEARVYAEMGGMYRRASRMDVAEKYWRDRLSKASEAFGPESAEAAKALCDLGALLLDKGDMAGAEPFFEKAWKIVSSHPHDASVVDAARFGIPRYIQLLRKQSKIAQAATVSAEWQNAQKAFSKPLASSGI